MESLVQQLNKCNFPLMLQESPPASKTLKTQIRNTRRPGLIILEQLSCWLPLRLGAPDDGISRKLLHRVFAQTVRITKDSFKVTFGEDIQELPMRAISTERSWHRDLSTVQSCRSCQMADDECSPFH